MPVSVPYRPYGDANAEFIATPEVRLSTPLQAFGGGVARAIESTGADISHVGNELWQRAVALQELKNESEARELNANYTIEVGKREAEFLSREGKDAANSATDYYKGLHELRDTMKATASNPDVQRRFEAEATGNMARGIFNGARHAAAENKRYFKESIDLDNKATIDRMEQDYDNPNAFEEAKAKLEKNSHTFAGLHGWDEGDGNRQVHLKDEVSKLAYKKVTEMSRWHPIQAQKWLDEHSEDLGERLGAAKNYIEDHVRGELSRGVSHSINGDLLAGKDSDEPLDSRLRKGVEVARKMRPEDEKFVQSVEDAITRDFREYHARIKQRDDTNLNLVLGGIMGVGKNGKIPENMDELLADPKIRGAYEAMPEKERIQIKGKLDRYRNSWNQDTFFESKTKLMGMAQEDPQAFLALDVTKEKLSQADKAHFMKLQQTMRTQAVADPQVKRALSILAGDLNAANISRNLDKDRYHTFVGALQDAMIEAKAANGGKNLLYEDIQKLGRTLLYDQADRSGFWGRFKSTDRFFEHVRQLPEKEVAKARESWMKDHPNEFPTDEDIVRDYARQRFKEAWKSKKDATETPKR